MELVDSFECVKMHGPKNPRFINAKQAGDIHSLTPDDGHKNARNMLNGI